MKNSEIIEEIIQMFRVWNRDWSIYDIKEENNIRPNIKPKSLDTFIEELDKLYKIEKIKDILDARNNESHSDNSK